MNAKTEKKAMEKVERIVDFIKNEYALCDAIDILESNAETIKKWMGDTGYGCFSSFSDFLKWVAESYEKAAQNLARGSSYTPEKVARVLAYCRGI